MRKPDNSLLLPQGLFQSLTEADPYILDGVMRVDLEIALAADIEIEDTVLGEKQQHVVQKRDPGIDFPCPASIQVEHNLDIGFTRSACNRGLPFFDCHHCLITPPGL